ncbi:MAG: o-succinylbenzoate synthase [Candidatus Nitricoxidivorans perseverans]|uniref:o-succinylbenzoate synthase n=1 Tax=Candidatus Nitricoxidivorans perseverans TaxID=2975601 RepID=A0AA49FKD7_9PROT|nr:MAG: o-succinylbenzoate synthase [Candidatus Nitricoxidivorans perseverans]
MPRLRLHPYCLPLRRPWIAASATLSERRGWLVEAIDADGTVGWGDCAPLPSAGMTGEAQVRWALETALIDLEARRRGLPLARLLGAANLSVPVNAALGPLDEGCAERAADAVAQGFRTAKLKVGVAPMEEELARLRELGDGLRLRLDANRAWNEDEARRFLTAAANLPVEAIEEPLAEPTLDGLARLQAAVPFALAVDESMPALGAVALFASRAVRRLVLKPARVGGVLQALALARWAQAAGMDVVITSVVDSAIGVAAAAHLAAALGGPAHGLATGAWLAADVAAPLPVAGGFLTLPDAPGLGIAPG